MLIGLWLSREDEIRRRASEPPEEYTEYFMNQFSLLDINDEGGIKYRLQADEMTYLSSNIAELSRPKLRVLSERNATWSLEAEQGRIEYGSVFFFGGDVNIEQQRLQQDILFVRTRDVTFDAAVNIVATDQHVQLKSGNNAVEAVGMRYDIEHQQVYLLSNVRGQYFARP